MWIIPKPLHTLASVQDTEALTSDLNELSEMCERSLIARSQTSPARTWLRRWKQKDSHLTLRLSGRILRPFRGQAFVDEWTSSQEGSLVSLLAPQGADEETRIPDTCGPTSLEGSESWDDLPLFSLRMWKDSSPQSSTETTGPTQQVRQFCSMCSASWSDWVMTQRREYSARAKSAHLTSESECSYLAFAPTSPQKGALLFQGGSPQQAESAWATPTAATKNRDGSHEHYQRRAAIGKQLSLHAEVVLGSQSAWPTPTTQEIPHYDMKLTPCGRRVAKKEGGGTHSVNLWDADRTSEGTHGPQDEDSISTLGNHQESPNAGNLNPRWVEMLMGLPMGWAMPSCQSPVTVVQTNSCYSATELCPQSQSEPSESFGGAWATPTTRDYKGAYSEESQALKPRSLLPDQVKMWTTPVARDRYEAVMNQSVTPRKDGTVRDDTMPRQVHEETGYSGTINPRWVESLMGLPVGWVMPSCKAPIHTLKVSDDDPSE